MAWVWADRVLDTSVTTGTGPLAVSGTPPSGWRTFSAVCTVADTFYYTIHDPITGAWETGEGTYSAANTITRTTVRQSSNGNALVTFAANAKNVFIDVIGYWFGTALPGTYLPLAGGALTGTLYGTVSNFSTSVAAGYAGTVGSVRMAAGDATHMGNVAFYDLAGTRQGYIGYSQPIITYAAEITGGYHDFYSPGSRFSFNANRLTINSPDTLNNLILIGQNGLGGVYTTVAGSVLNFGVANAYYATLGTTAFAPYSTKLIALGGAANIWNGLHVTATVFYGATSGAITVNPPAVAGANTITWPAATGTVALTSDVAAVSGGQVTAVNGTHPNAVADNVIGTFTASQGNAGSWFVPSTGRYTPPAGKYFIQCQGSTQAPSGGNGTASIKLRKNGTALINGPGGSGQALFAIPLGMGAYVDANGTDFFDFVIACQAASMGSQGNYCFTAFKVG